MKNSSDQRNADAGTCTTPAHAAPLAVVTSRTPWSEPPRMRHFITWQLARFYDVLYVEIPKAQISRESEQSEVDARIRLHVLQNTAPCSPRVYANNPFVHHRWNKTVVANLEALLATETDRQLLLINFTFDVPEIMSIPRFAFKAYICNDEFPARTRGREQHRGFRRLYQQPLLQAYENAVARRADLCLSPHTPLVEKLNRVNPDSRLCIHGHSFTPSIPGPAKRDPGAPIKVGFTGYLNDRLLFDWLLEVPKQPDMELHMNGPKETRKPEILREHEESGKLKYHGIIPDSRFYEYLCGIDVFVMVYDARLPEVAIMTTNSKIYQYVAALKPIVMSPMPNYLRLPQGVLYEARSRDEFIKTIRQAFAEDCDEFRALRLQVANENTWDRRGDMLHQIIEQALAQTSDKPTEVNP